MQEIALGIAKNVEYLKSDDKDEKYKKQLLKTLLICILIGQKKLILKRIYNVLQLEKLSQL